MIRSIWNYSLMSWEREKEKESRKKHKFKIDLFAWIKKQIFISVCAIYKSNIPKG